ncbi:MAG: nitronate monooxygenase [Chloroflexi bacterium]|nr:nitronate monooxygenase [Chloroflexota bacterium]
MSKNILRTKLCDMLGIEYPIILAGMGSRGKATPSKLVAAVSNAGGLGVTGGSGMEPEEIRKRIREIRGLTDKPFGVDLLLPASMADVQENWDTLMEKIGRENPEHVSFMKKLMKDLSLPEVQVERRSVMSRDFIRRQVEVCLEEKVPVFAAGLGDPSWMIPDAHAQGIKIMGLVGSVRNAVRQVKAGVDIVIAQGYEAGGHTGRIATMVLVPQVADAVNPVPVVAAGGIADGRGLAASLALGAVGVWCGTAFLVAQECEIYPVQKKQILEGRSEDFIVTRAYTGKTARDYKNEVIEAWERSGLQALPMPLQGILFQSLVESAEKFGRPELINNPAGQVAGMLKEQKPARQIIEEMIQEAVEVLRRFRREVTIAGR